MYVVCVTIWVKPEFVPQFIELTLENARGTRKEAGNLRFDVSRGEDDPNRFFLYELYKTEDAFKSHQQQPHYFKWRDGVQDWMGQTRQALKYQNLFAE